MLRGRFLQVLIGRLAASPPIGHQLGALILTPRNPPRPLGEYHPIE